MIPLTKHLKDISATGSVSDQKEKMDPLKIE